MKPPDSKNKIRVFIAVPIPKNVSLFLGKLQGEIKENRFKASWTRTDAMHLTLRFIGDIPGGRVDTIIRAMKFTADACAPFTLSLGGVGVFPSVKRAGIIWAGVRGQTHRLEMVHTLLQENLDHQGFGSEGDARRFIPHLTLGRFKGRVDGKSLVEMIRRCQHLESEENLFTSMVLFKSDLTPSGAVHTPLFEAMLSGIPVIH